MICAVAACGDSGSSSASGSDTDAAASSGGTTGGGGSTGGGASDPTTGAGPTSGQSTTTDGGSATGGLSQGTTDATTTASPSTGEPDTTGGPPVDAVYDPDKDGPCSYGEIAANIKVGEASVPVVAYYPTDGPVAGPFPIVTVAHGFNIAPTQYTNYAKRLASHCYVALNVDHRGYIGQTVSHPAYAKQILAAVDWATSEPTLGGIVDADNVGTTGHSLGGKISVLAAMYDARVKASITLDPVDGANMCPNMMACPDVSGMLPISIPLGYLGETSDSDGFMACAPAAENYTTFYAESASPALQVTVNGASHVSFVDDVGSCGLSCALCKQAMLDNQTVNALSRAFVVAFFGRYLRKNTGYDTYLTGAEAQARYVDMGLVSIESK